MEDLEDYRVPNGTAADFSKWGSSVKTEGFEPIKKKQVVIKETIKDPLEEESKVDLSKVNNQQELPQHEVARKMAAEQYSKQEQLEYANITLKFLPTADVLTDANFEYYLEKALHYAFRFKQEWRKQWEKHQEEKES